MIWHNRRGEVVKTLIAGAPKAVLYADGIATARFGEGVSEVVARLSRSVGPPATSLQQTACGPVETIGWRAPVTVYFRNGRFVGYAYGSPTPQALPEPVLATAKGLVLGETVAQASRLYGGAFHTSEEKSGTWFINTPNGLLDGFGYLRTKLRRGVIGPQSTITTIQAGPRPCAGLWP